MVTINAALVGASDSLERFRQEFNTLHSDISSNSTITDGTSNFIAGLNAGAALQSGSLRNVLVGDEAGSSITTGDDNVAIGHAALDANTTASNNTAVGKGAGTAVTTGHENTLIGNICHDNLTTGDLNTALGYNLAPSAVGVDSEIVIGSSTTGGGTNTIRIGTAGGHATLGLDGSDSSWAADSDARLKKDVATSTAGLEFIKDLRPVTFKWQLKNAVESNLPQYDADSSEPIYGEGNTHHGFIAQEVKTVIDSHSDVVNGHNVWHEDPDGTQQVAPGALVPMLVKAIQEQNILIEALTARIIILEG